MLEAVVESTVTPPGVTAMFLLALLIFFLVLGILVNVCGADSRGTRDWRELEGKR